MLDHLSDLKLSVRYLCHTHETYVVHRALN